MWACRLFTWRGVTCTKHSPRQHQLHRLLLTHAPFQEIRWQAFHGEASLAKHESNFSVRLSDRHVARKGKGAAHANGCSVDRTDDRFRASNDSQACGAAAVAPVGFIRRTAFGHIREHWGWVGCTAGWKVCARTKSTPSRVTGDNDAANFWQTTCLVQTAYDLIAHDLRPRIPICRAREGNYGHFSVKVVINIEFDRSELGCTRGEMIWTFVDRYSHLVFTLLGNGRQILGINMCQRQTR